MDGDRYQVSAGRWVLALLGLAACAPSRSDDMTVLEPAARTCEDPGQGSTEWLGVDHNEWATLAGQYELDVVPTGGAPPGTAGGGRMTLWVNDSLHQRFSVFHEFRPDVPLFFPFYGAVDSSFVWPTWISTMTDPASRDPDMPGIQFHKSGPHLSFIVGSPTNPRITVSDAGVLFYVRVVDTLGMRGRWEDGGWVYPVPPSGETWGRPEGYFCAWKPAGSGGVHGR